MPAEHSPPGPYGSPEANSEGIVLFPISRRVFLGGAATVGALDFLLPRGARRAIELAADPAIIGPPPQTVYTLGMRRAADQCVLTLTYFNMAPDFTQSPPALTQTATSALYPTLLVVSFPPQSVLEDASVLSSPLKGQAAKTPPIPSSSTTSHPASPPVHAYLAGGSRVAFFIAAAGASTPAIPLVSTSILDWVSNFTLNTVPSAVAPGKIVSGQGPINPGSGETAIQLPYHLITTPDPTQTFVNAADPITHDNWTELWHTRLAGLTVLEFIPPGGGTPIIIHEANETDRNRRYVRAVWCTDSQFPTDLNKNTIEPTSSGTFSLTYTDRYDIVRLSSDYRLDTSTRPYVPMPATADRLMLTSLGGWLDSEAHWNLPATTLAHSTSPSTWNTSLLQWRHRATQARDSYVRVVRKGYLFPFGHRASLVTVTEREPSHIGDTTTQPVGAYMRQKIFLVVAAPVKDYPASSPGMPNAGRQFPFTTVEALTLVTPDFDAEKVWYNGFNGQYQTANGKAPSATNPLQPEKSFQPTIGGSPFHFHFRGTDWSGATFDFRSPVVWVDDTIAYGANDTSAPIIVAIVDAWRAKAASARTVTFNKARIAVAPPANPSVTAGDTQVAVANFELDGLPAVQSAGITKALAGASQPRFYPTLSQMVLAMPEAATVSGNSVSNPTMQYYSDYVKNGFGTGGVFLSTTGVAPSIRFNASNSGGSVTPNLMVNGRSRELGPASGNLPELNSGTFKPANVFKGVNAKLLGGLQLQNILKQVSFGGGTGNAKALQLTSVEQHNPDGSVAAVITTMDWHPAIQQGGPLPGVTIFSPTDGANPPNPIPEADNSFDLHAVIVSTPNPANSTTTVTGQIRNFEIDLFGNSGPNYFIQIPFDSLTFRSQTGQKTDVAVQINASGVGFEGALSFVQTLAEYLSFDGSGLTIDTAGSAITITLTLAIPSIGLGVFSLENLAFSAGCSIPYNGDPVLFNFAFCSRENPFMLTIYFLGGGGYVELSIGAEGLQQLEMGFDFGASVSIDIGIASGGISVLGGVYFEISTVNDGTTPHAQDVDLTAYVKASGGISALGVISVSIELYLALSYQDNAGESSVTGEAEMSLAVHIVFFGFSVSVSVQKTFAGSGATSGAVEAAAASSQTSHPLMPTSGSGARRAALRPATTSAAASPATTTFGTALTYAEWTQYCDSFALVGVGE